MGRILNPFLVLCTLLSAAALAAEGSEQQAPAGGRADWLRADPLLAQVVGPGLPPAPPAPVPPPQAAPQPIFQDRAPDSADQAHLEQELPEWLDGFRIGGMVRFRPEFHQNFNFDRTDRTLFTSFTSICSKARTADRSCSQSGGTEYPDFSKSNHSAVPLYIAEEDSKEVVLQKVQLAIHKEFGADINAHLVIQDSRVWGGQPGSLTGINTANGNTDEATDIREANLEIFDLIGPIALQIGRQTLVYGDQRLVGAFEWNNVGRSFDGLRFRFEGEDFQSHLWGMVLAESSDDFDGATSGNESQPEIKDAYFSGWYNTWEPSEHFLGELYYFGVYKKWIQRTDPLVVFVNDRPEVLTDEYGIGIASHQRSFQRDNLHTGGMRLTNRTRNGQATVPFDWTVEGAKQGGQTGEQKTPDFLDIALSDEKFKIKDQDGRQVYELLEDPEGGYYVSEYMFHQLITKPVRYDGYAVAAELGWTPVKLIRIGVEYTEASGDADPNDHRNQTFQNLFPTNHLHMGTADLSSWRNIRGRSGNLTFDFGAGGQLRMEFWDIDKHSREDAWYVASGAANSVATTEAPADYAPPAGDTESKENQYLKRIAKRELWKKLYLRKHLFEEFDLIYQVKYKGLHWSMGYSLIGAGDSVRVAKDDYGYLLAVKYLDEVLFYESVHRTAHKVFFEGDFKTDATPPTFDPRANFAYVQLTFQF